MTPSPRAARSLDEALCQALEDLETGLSPLQVLEQYPEYEADLAPLLETAYRLRTTRWPVLSMAARVAGREKMHAALTEQKRRRWFVVPPIWRQVGAGVALLLLAGTTYIASPISPLRPSNRPGFTATAPVSATATWTAVAPPTAEPRATVLVVVTRNPLPTLAVRRTVEPTETIEREVRPTYRQQPAVATAAPTATPTRPTRTRVPTSTATVTPANTLPATATVVGPAGPVPTTTAPPPTSPSTPVDPTATPTASPAKPSQTPTTQPTAEPEPTNTSTVRPSPTPRPTNTPAPSQTPWPDLTPTRTPAPTFTPLPPTPTRTRRPTRTPEPTSTPEETKTPEATRTPEPTDTSPSRGVIISVLRDEGLAPGYGLRSALREWRRSESSSNRDGRR